MPSRLPGYLLLTLTGVSLLPGWGDKPHHDIVDAAVSALPAEERLVERLGSEARKLTTLVMMGDWKDSTLSVHAGWAIGGKRVSELEARFYSNDYLIFPGAPRSYQHDVPDVVNTYRPFFLRALQALRTESRANSARWLGSLLHFVTDTGSPPHALVYKGDIHTKMENWLDASQIDMKGYRPQLLGRTDEEALPAFLRRMQGLTEFSRPRAERLLPFIQANDRAHCEPIALESAAETARVAADTLHTLLVLSADLASSGELRAEVSAVSAAGMEGMPARLVLLGTTYSTVSEPVSLRQNLYQGTLLLRNLPPGVYRPVVYRTGARPVFEKPLTVKNGGAVRMKWDLAAETPAGNLVRNADLNIRWTLSDRPEHWRYDGQKKRWISDAIAIEAGARYRAGLEASAGAQVSLRWMHELWQPPVGIEELSRGETKLVAPAEARHAELMIEGSDDPANRVYHISFSAL